MNTIFAAVYQNRRGSILVGNGGDTSADAVYDVPHMSIARPLPSQEDWHSLERRTGLSIASRHAIGSYVLHIDGERNMLSFYHTELNQPPIIDDDQDASTWQMINLRSNSEIARYNLGPCVWKLRWALQNSELEYQVDLP